MAELVSSWLGEGWQGRCAWLQLVSYASCFLFCVAVCLAEAERNKWLIINEKSSVLLNCFVALLFLKKLCWTSLFYFCNYCVPSRSSPFSFSVVDSFAASSVPLPPSLHSLSCPHPAVIRLATAQANLLPVPSKSPHNTALACSGRLFSVDAVPVDWHYFNLLLDLCLVEAKRLR